MWQSLLLAALKDQKKTRGKTRLTRMLKEQRPMKFFTVPGDRLKEFAKEAKARGILYVVMSSFRTDGFSFFSFQLISRSEEVFLLREKGSDGFFSKN